MDSLAAACSDPADGRGSHRAIGAFVSVVSGRLPVGAWPFLVSVRPSMAVPGPRFCGSVSLQVCTFVEVVL